MKDPIKNLMTGYKLPNYAVLDFGVFIVGSSTHSGIEHALCVAYVPRVGPLEVETPWRWKGDTCPIELAEATTLRAEAFTIDAILHIYGMGQGLPF